MPFYEYQCKSCGHHLEAMQKISDAPLKKCPQCGRSQLQRLMSAPVFRLKGGGWYETDFKSDKDTKRNLADRPEADAAKAADAKSTGAKGADSSAKPADKPAEKTAEKAASKAQPAAASKPARRPVARKPAARKAAGKAPAKSGARRR